MAPELLGDGAGAGVLALPLRHGALGTVAQEEEPSLLLGHILLLLLQLLPLLCAQAGQRMLPVPHVPIQDICTSPGPHQSSA